MEKLKDPAMLLSVANSIGLIGTTAYFYKQLEAIRLDMVKMSQTLNGVVRKLSELEKGEQHKNEALHTLNDQIKRINDQIDELPSFDAVDNLDVDLTEIVTVLSEQNIQVERPSQQSRSRRSGDRRSARRPTDTDERRDNSARRATAHSDRSRDMSTRDSDLRSSRQPTRETRPAPSRDQRIESGGYDDDADLIGEVRRQQNRP